MAKERVLTKALKVKTLNETNDIAQAKVIEVNYDLGIAIAELTLTINGELGQSDLLTDELVSVNQVNHETGEVYLNFFPTDGKKRIEDLAIVMNIEESTFKVAKKYDLGNGSNTIDGDFTEDFPAIIEELKTVLG